jgi:putative DNA methylase
MKFGEADVLARAKNTSVDHLAGQGALYAQKGVVRLLTREEIKASIDPREDFIWLLTQQLTQAMETGGVIACAKIVAELFGMHVDQAKALAYRLYTIAERKGWAGEAFAYNALVISWPEVQAKAAELMSRGDSGKQLKLFDDTDN